ncbi:MAG: hypothetical protein QOJ79_553 [Actinomycetota bacterium]|nr:hypothetical protein [Actinomycetota bacterium]
MRVPSADPADPESVARTFLATWSAQRYGDLAALVDDQTSDVAGIYQRFAERLGIESINVRPGAFDAATKTLAYHATLQLHELGELPVDNVLHVAAAGAGPKVVFTSATVFPGLVAGQRVVRTATALRGRLLDDAGRPLRGVDRDLDVNVLGPVSADGHGKGGLELALDRQLAGSPATQIQVVSATTGELVRVVATFGAGHDAPDVTTTLQPAVQRAAEAALARARGPAALVAIDTRTGAVRAVANAPLTGFPSALRGSYAPGSTFKTVTALAALMHGFTPASQLDCPATVTAGGKQFRNHEAGSRGRISLLTAYAQSCNTAFVNLSQSLPKGSVTAAARLLGFDAAEPLLPVPSAGGTLPPPADTAEAAADAIGQGRVEASPLLMASVAAAVADGMWRQPRLTSCPRCSEHPLPAAAVSGLRQLMRAVVTSGTGSALAPFATPPVSAKTGTAEFGAGTPPSTHAWMIGFRGHLAFAVYVETGESGGRTAGPIAAAFLRAAG